MSTRNSAGRTGGKKTAKRRKATQEPAGNLVTVAAFAKLVGVHRSEVYRSIERGRIACRVKSGRKLIDADSQVPAWKATAKHGELSDRARETRRDYLETVVRRAELEHEKVVRGHMKRTDFVDWWFRNSEMVRRTIRQLPARVTKAVLASPRASDGNKERVMRIMRTEADRLMEYWEHLDMGFRSKFRIPAGSDVEQVNPE